MAVYEEKDGIITCIIPDLTKEQIIDKSRGNVIMEEEGVEITPLVEIPASPVTIKGETNGEV